MPKIKTVIGWLIAVATSATLPVRGGGVSVGYRQLGVVDVPDGVVSNVDSVVLGDQSTLYKTGAGTLAVNGGALKSVTDERLTVLEGAVSVTTSADADFTTPPAVCDIAAFWVNASSVATTNGVVEEGETPPVFEVARRARDESQLAHAHLRASKVVHVGDLSGHAVRHRPRADDVRRT